jgi:hypothetical protein
VANLACDLGYRRVRPQSRACRSKSEKSDFWIFPFSEIGSGAYPTAPAGGRGRLARTVMQHSVIDVRWDGSRNRRDWVCHRVRHWIWRSRIYFLSAPQGSAVTPQLFLMSPRTHHVHATRKWHSDDALPRPGFESTAVYFEWLPQKESATTTNDNDYRRWRAFTVPSKGVFLRMDRLLRRAAGSGGSPPPVLFLFALHCGRCWVLRLDPVPRSARAVGRAKALRHDAFEPDLLPQSTFWMPDGGHAAKVRGRVCVCS